MSVATAVRPSFTEDRLQKLIDIEQRHFWFEGRRRLVRRLIGRYLGPAPKTLLDIGSGGGYFCRQLAGEGYRMTAADFIPSGLRGLRNQPEICGVQCSVEALALRAEAFDGAMVLDVLEHVHDVTAVRELTRALKPGGRLFVTVPAVPWLWSYRDEDAGHKRRYRRSDLIGLLKSAGLSVDYVTYYQFFLFPLTAASRVMGRGSSRTRDLEDMPPPVVNAVLSAVNRMESALGHLWRYPWGSSLVAVARKSEESV
jgi:SAM-dependent methyltransferase